MTKTEDEGRKAFHPCSSLTSSPSHWIEMPQTTVYILLLFALALPVLGGVLLRLLIPRLSQAQLYGGAALIFGLAIASVLLLARGDIPSLQIGRLSILLPVTAPDDSSIVLAPSDQDA